MWFILSGLLGFWLCYMSCLKSSLLPQDQEDVHQCFLLKNVVLLFTFNLLILLKLTFIYHIRDRNPYCFHFEYQCFLLHLFNSLSIREWSPLQISHTSKFHIYMSLFLDCFHFHRLISLLQESHKHTDSCFLFYFSIIDQYHTMFYWIP